MRRNTQAGRLRSVLFATAHFQKFRLVQKLDAKLLRLFQFGTGFGAGQDKIRFLAHAAGHFAASGFNFCRGFLARQRRQRAGEDKSFAGENSGFARSKLPSPV